MSEQGFMLPRSSWAEVKKMVHAYFLADKRTKGEAVTLDDVAGHAGMNRTVVSGNNGFLAALGVIEGGHKKRVTAGGRQLGLALSHSDEGLTRSALLELVAGSEFLERILNAVRIRGGMDAAALQSHIAISAGVGKSAVAMTGAAAIVNLLLEAGVVTEDGGTLRVAPSQKSDNLGTAATWEVAEPETTLEGRVYRLPTVSLPFSNRPNVQVNINLNLTADSFEKVVELIERLTGVQLEAPPPAAGTDDRE